MWTVALLLLGTTHALVCPTTSCGELPAGTCAKVQGSNIVLQNCTSEFTCNIQDIFALWPTDGATLKCTALPRISFSLAEEHFKLITNRFCEGLVGRKLVSGHPRQCASDNDCMLEGGGYGFCVCAMDGRAYCQYEKGDTPYAELQTAMCSDEKEDPDVLSARLLAYITKIHLYPLTVSTIQNMNACADRFFDDASSTSMVMLNGDTIVFEMINTVFGRWLTIAGFVLLTLG